MEATSKPVVLITGASSGIGKICAEHLHAQGYRVYGTSRRAAVAPSSDGFRLIAMDVTSEDSVAQAIELILSREGRLDVVFNNAGDGIAGAVEDTSIEEARQQLDTNFFGVLRVCRAALPVMRKQGAGLILNVSSLGGLVGLPFQGLYSASKFAVEGMTEVLRMEVRPFGVRVALIEPGDFRTGFTAQRRKVRAAQGSNAYTARFDKALATMERDENGGADPIAVAHLLERLITTRSPRPRYKVGGFFQKLSVGPLRKILPQKLFEYLLMSSYGIA
ncbi:MAG: family NAD(P)-dependent oxidoreductase [Nevskia sp.]|nr:family NAD(P)-dependent oxidoreductase [Nevskia sp.]